MTLSFAAPSAHATPSKKPKVAATPAADSANSPQSSDSQLETFQDLILKAQNLTLQQDRLQTSQVLTRAIQREAKGSVAYRELVRALDELTAVFYTEKAQSLFAAAEALAESKPHDAIDQLQEALKAEDRNPTILKEIARVHLRLDECDKGEARVRQAEEVDSYSAEVKLLRLQLLACQKNFDALEAKLSLHDPDMDATEKFSRGLQMRLLMRPASKTADAPRELKKAKTFLQTWESQAADYPEVYYWKWELSKAAGDPDRTAAAKYSQLCENLSPRRRKSFSLDVELCKGKEVADAYLKESSSPTAPGAAKEAPKPAPKAPEEAH